MISRRGFIGTAAVLAGASAVSGRVQAASIPEAPITATNTMQAPIFPTGGPDYQPVVTLNGWTLPWRMNGDWKEFHLVAEPVDRDFVFIMNAYDVDPGSYLPKVATMTDFNMWTWNSRVFPGIDPLVVRKGDRVRVRMGNLTMTNHPIHLHGYHFSVTCTDGGWVPDGARWPETSIDVPVGA